MVFACSPNDSKTFSCNIFHYIKYVVLLQSNAPIVDIEYPQGICSPIFDLEEFSGLFAHSSIFLIKDSIST